MGHQLEQLESRRLFARVGIDAAFGDAGSVTLTSGSLQTTLADGKVIAVSDAKVIKLRADGSADPTFTDKGAAPATRDVERVITSGKLLLVAGRFTSQYKYFIRAISAKTGEVDTSFGDAGMVTITPAPVNSAYNITQLYLTSLVQLADGGVVISIAQYLSRSSGKPTSFNGDVLYKFTDTGDPDTNFGNNGALVVNSGSDLTFDKLVALPAGGFLTLRDIHSWTSVLEKRDNNGVIDASFRNSGTEQLAVPTALFPSFETPRLQSDGKIVLTVTDQEDLNSIAFVMRLNADGTTDESFGKSGFVNLGVGSATEAAIDGNGRILTGVSDRLYRLTADGSLDPTFDDDGLAAMNFSPGTIRLDSAASVVVSNGKKIERFVVGKAVELGPDRILRVDGTENADTISTSLSNGIITLNLNGVETQYTAVNVVGEVINGLGGNDTIYSSDVNPATIHSGEGNDTIGSTFGADVIYGDQGNDVIASGAEKDLVFGGAGNDVIDTGAGDDKAFGELGNDSISGGDGNDKLYGGFAIGISTTDPDYEDGDDSLSGNAGNDRLAGQVGNDRLAGNGGRDRLFGGDGNDRIFGGASGDWLYGEPGADQLNGEGGDDRLYADESETGSFAGSIDTLHGNAGNDLLISKDSQIDKLFGDGGTDSASADAGDEKTSVEVSV